MKNLIIVGIGSSAGGLPAMIDLLAVASCHKSMCFVVVSHVSRFRENELPTILGRVANLDALVIENGMRPEACKLYTIPANSYVELSDGAFKLSPRPLHQPNRSVDTFFESLARAHGTNAVGVILSGAKVGNDGADGVIAIKQSGGHTFAQVPSDALFPDMPLEAIATGCVDSVLPPPIIGHELSLLSWVIQAET